MVDNYEELKQIVIEKEIQSYQKRGFNPQQTQEIMVGWQEELNIDRYAHTDYSALQMRVIREGLERMVDVTGILRPTMTAVKMKAELDQLSMIVYDPPTGFTLEQKIVLEAGLQHGVDTTVYADPILSPMFMEELLHDIIDGHNVSDYVNIVRLRYKVESKKVDKLISLIVDAMDNILRSRDKYMYDKAFQFAACYSPKVTVQISEQMKLALWALYNSSVAFTEDEEDEDDYTEDVEDEVDEDEVDYWTLGWDKEWKDDADDEI